MRYKLYKYTLPFLPPFKERSGLVLHLIDRGWGEIAPFPGRNRETLEQAQEQLIHALKDLGQRTEPLYPSVAFGLFSALNHRSESRSVPLCALLVGSPDQILTKAHQAAREGFKCAKVKVSDFSVNDSINIIQQLSPLFSLRVDANRAFSFEEAVQIGAQCPGIEYIEEPTHALDKLEEFPYPFALDESLLELAELPVNPQFTTIIFKPSMLGGWEECLSYAIDHRKKIVFSSLCETGIGIAGIASLSLSMPFATSALGVDTYRFLPQDILKERLDFQDGHLILPNTLAVDTHLLQEIARG